MSLDEPCLNPNIMRIVWRNGIESPPQIARCETRRRNLYDMVWGN